MPRRPQKPPSTDVGCGYKASVSGNSVTIRPTVLNSNCRIKIGLGDAHFTIDPTDPPKTITRIITKDASGTYAPLVESAKERHTKSFESFEIKDETFTDADGKVTQLTYPELTGYKEEYVAGEYKASGINSFKNHQKIMW